MNDQPHWSGLDRIAVYRVWGLGDERQRLAETSLTGLGLCLLTLHDDGEFEDGDRIGVLDRETRKWIVNPWVPGPIRLG